MHASHTATFAELRRLLATLASAGAPQDLRPLNVPEIEKWEAHYAIHLPDDYRRFLQEIGEGAPGPGGTLLSLVKGAEYQGWRGHMDDFLQRPFPFSAVQTEKILRDKRNGLYAFAVEKLWGFLTIAEYGSGWSYILPLNGEEAGRMWLSDGTSESTPVILTNAATDATPFLDWYHDWLLHEVEKREALQQKDAAATRTHLLFANQVMNELSDALLAQKELETLSITNTHLDTLPETIGTLSHLHTLTIFYNQIATLPDSFGSLRSLETLTLQSNQLTALPDSFGALSRLRHFQAGHNRLSRLPATIGNCTALEELLLEGNVLDTLPASFHSLRALRVLDLSQNRLATLPEDIGALRNLEVLRLNGNALRTLPASFSKLHKLQRLSLYNNPLDLAATLPLLATLPALRTLDITITDDVPESIGDLAQLTQLTMRGDKNVRHADRHLPKQLQRLRALRVLQCIDLGLTNIPDELWQLTALETLVMNGNRFSTISEHIAHLKNLHTLAIASNNLTALPENIANLTALRTLSLYDNQLTALPEQIGNLTHLCLLEAGKNNLTHIPNGLRRIHYLPTLELQENPLAAEEKSRIQHMLWVPDLVVDEP